MIGKRRAYILLAGLILFNLAIPIASAWGFEFGTTEHTAELGDNKSIVDLYTDGFGSWDFWLSVAGVAGVLVAASRIGGIHVTFSTVVFAGTFLATSAPLQGILGDMTSAGYISSGVEALIIGIYSIAFLIGIMELSR